MAVLATKSEKLCKLCQAEKRPDIDALLEKRSNGEKDEAGNRINEQYVLKTLGEWGVTNPTKENITNHWRKHCQKTSNEIVAAAQDEAATRVLAILRGEQEKRDLDGDLDLLWAIGVAEIEARAARGHSSGITPDLMMKIAAEKNKRQHNETQSELLGALVGGIGAALGAKQIADGEVVVELEAVDAEYVEV